MPDVMSESLKLELATGFIWFVICMGVSGAVLACVTYLRWARAVRQYFAAIDTLTNAREYLMDTRVRGFKGPVEVAVLEAISILSLAKIDVARGDLP